MTKPHPTLELSPLVEVLTTCTALLFLLAFTAEVDAIQVDQHLSDPGGCAPAPEVIPPPPLTVHVRADGVWVGRWFETGIGLPRSGGAVDRAAVEAEIVLDRASYPHERQVVIVTDDGVAYGDMIVALDLTRAHGYDQTLLGGGPARGS